MRRFFRACCGLGMAVLLTGQAPLPPEPDFARNSQEWRRVKPGNCWYYFTGRWGFSGWPTWDGGCDGQKITGSGTLVFTSLSGQRPADTITGTFVDGKLTGQGVVTFSSGTRLEGNFADGSQNGQGRDVSALGWVYTGAYKDGRRFGMGEYSYPNGSRYQGQFDGTAKGHGILTYGDQSLEGEFGGVMPKGQVILRQAGQPPITGLFERPVRDPATPLILPPFPPILIRLNHEFHVMAYFTILADGALQDIRCVTPSDDQNYGSLAEECVKALETVRYTPAKVNGTAIAMPYIMDIGYALRDAPLFP